MFLSLRAFRPAGDVTHAVMLERPPSFTTGNKIQLTKSQKDGLRYEKRVQEYVRRLCEHYPAIELRFNPWFLYHNRSSGSSAALFCQPDILLIRSGFITIMECKHSHTNDSWEQLRLLYEPVLKKAYPGNNFALLEICKWYDPHVRYSETFYYCEDPLSAIAGKLGIHIYKPRGRPREDN